MTPLMIVLAAAPATAAPATAAPATTPSTAPKISESGTRVKEVVVVSGPGPKIVSSFPADGGQAPGGVLVLKVVFDQPMAPDAWSYGPADNQAAPNCLDRPRLLADKRTTVLLCSVAAHASYAVRINPTPQFASADGRTAAPAVLRFTTGEVGVRSLHDALSQADLSDADDPIMRWQDSGAGVSHSEPAN